MNPETKYAEYKLTLILAPGEVDRDWLKYQRKRMLKDLWKGFCVGCWGIAGFLALIYYMTH